jgi:hypothetical protein
MRIEPCGLPRLRRVDDAAERGPQVYWPVRWRLLAAVAQTFELFQNPPQAPVRLPRRRSLPALRKRLASPVTPVFHSRRFRPSDYAFPGWELPPFRPRMYWGPTPRRAERDTGDVGKKGKPGLESGVPTFALLSGHPLHWLHEALSRLRR